MVSQIGRHSINMEALMGKDLDKLAEVITEALQEERPMVGAKPRPGAAVSTGDNEGNREPLAAMQLNRDQDLKSNKGQDPNQKERERMKQKGVTFFSWGEYKLAAFEIIAHLISAIDVRLWGALNLKMLKSCSACLILRERDAKCFEVFYFECW